MVVLWLLHPIAIQSHNDHINSSFIFNEIYIISTNYYNRNAQKYMVSANY